MPDAQELADRWYVKHGPCCAGCDSRRSRNRRDKRQPIATNSAEGGRLE